MGVALAEMGKPFRFDSERAKLAAMRSVEVRRKPVKSPLNSNGSPFRPELTPFASQEAEYLEQRLQKIREQMTGLTAGGKLLQLSLAYSKLFTAWQTLVGLEKPATRKRERQKQSWNSAAPQAEFDPQIIPLPVVCPADLAGNNQSFNR